MEQLASRFERHIEIPEVGLKGQEKLKNASVLIVGAGGLGCPAALYLAAGGIGEIGLVDNDIVSISNLQRQVLYTEADLDKPKVEIASNKLKEINSQCKINTYPFRLDESNITEIISEYDVVVDCTDNFDIRFLLNKECFAQKKKLISASVFHYDGQVSVYKAFEGAENPCYECLYPTGINVDSAPKSSGILGPVAGVLGTLQASAVINELLEVGASLSGSMLILNMLNFEVQKMRIKKRADCAVCGGA